MKIDRVILKNVKSFKDQTIFDFNGDFNIIVGPNGCGKSNLIDIINVVLNTFFIHSYSINYDGSDNIIGNIKKSIPPRDHISKNLDRFSGCNDEQRIDIHFRISLEDIINTRIIHNSQDDFKKVYNNKYTKNRDMRYPTLMDFDFNDSYKDKIVKYKIINGSINNITEDDLLEKAFLQYLNYFEFFSILSESIDDIKLNLPLIYFSPLRIENTQNLMVSLSVSLTGEDSATTKERMASFTSKNVFSLTRLAILRFAEKKRRFECSDETTTKLWNEDKDVISVAKQLKKIGYNWDLMLTNRNRNTYEVVLSKDGRDINISQTSSGEKEILNFILSIYSMGISNGLIIIDEPELHLHPKWQKVLFEMLSDISVNRNNQFILATHSSSFIDDNSILHITRMYKDITNSSKHVKLNRDYEITQGLHIINSTNNEKLLFSDSVFL